MNNSAWARLSTPGKQYERNEGCQFEPKFCLEDLISLHWQLLLGVPMATGATDEYWQREKLPSVYKHALLKRYLPIFGGKTGSRAGKVVFLDGYAGRGRNADGTPGSAELILQTAESQARTGISWQCFFFETDPVSYVYLEKVVAEYAKRGVASVSKHSEVEPQLEAVLKAADGLPLFLFLDPCGLGLPYGTLVQH